MNLAHESEYEEFLRASRGERKTQLQISNRENSYHTTSKPTNKSSDLGPFVKTPQSSKSYYMSEEGMSLVDLFTNIFVLDKCCYECGGDNEKGTLLKCACCYKSFCHAYCCKPPLDAILGGYWYCKTCEDYLRS